MLPNHCSHLFPTQPSFSSSLCLFRGTPGWYRITPCRQTKADPTSASGECAPASAHTAPLRTRLGSRAGSLSAHPAAARAPCALPPSLSPPVPREQVFFGALLGRLWHAPLHPARVRSGRSAHAPAIGSGRSPASAFATATAPGSGPPRGAQKRWCTWQGFCLPGCGALSCLAARPRR